MTKKKRNRILRTLLFLFLAALVAAGSYGYLLYKRIYLPNINPGKEDRILFIPTGSSMKDVTNLLVSEGWMADRTSFEWVADRKKYGNHVHPGRYRVSNNLSNNGFIDLLRSGEQEPINLTFNNIRTIYQLASEIAFQLEADSSEIVAMMFQEDKMTEMGFNKDNMISLFIPNTYEFYWNTSASGFIDRMQKEYNRFWTNERKDKAAKLNLSLQEVSTLASIVDKETAKEDEKARVAGVYINRLKKKMRLQADPTVIFAIGDFTIKRVLKTHLEFDSKYNTYRYDGLPPGPITLPTISAIDGVLNYEHHDYIFFCAKEDFSGYHNFAKTNAQHEVNARKYKAALDRRKIYK